MTIRGSPEPEFRPESVHDVVVAGYGNPLRRDDGVGWRVAEAVAERWGDHARVLIAQQPLPEWAAELASARVAYLIDAARGARPIRRPHMRRVRDGSVDPDVALLDGHQLDAEGLLRLTRAVYGCAPRAYLVLVPAADFAFGEELSPRAAAAVDSAAALLDHRLTREQRQRPSRPGHHGSTAARHGVDAHDHENHPRGWVADGRPVAYLWTS